MYGEQKTTFRIPKGGRDYVSELSDLDLYTFSSESLPKLERI
jgi:hypothetical protein